MLGRIGCFFGYHSLTIIKSVRHDPKHPRWVGLVQCRRCKRKYIMSNDHRAFLRVDNDPNFQKDLIGMYGTVGFLDTVNPLSEKDFT